MKRQLKWAVVLGVLVTFASVGLGDEGQHKHKTPGPKGGRILEKTDPQAEFFVEKDRTVTIAFYDQKLKPVPVGDQQVTVVAGKEKLSFEKKGDILASKSKLPEGDPYNIAVQLKQTPQAKPQNYRFKLDMNTCGECKRAEYACFCHE
jgi:hypothetical protein